MQVPPELASLRRLRILHLGGNLEEEFDTAAEADAMDAALRPLRNLQVGGLTGMGGSERAGQGWLGWQIAHSVVHATAHASYHPLTLPAAPPHAASAWKVLVVSQCNVELPIQH